MSLILVKLTPFDDILITSAKIIHCQKILFVRVI